MARMTHVEAMTFLLEESQLRRRQAEEAMDDGCPNRAETRAEQARWLESCAVDEAAFRDFCAHYAIELTDFVPYLMCDDEPGEGGQQ